MAEKEGNAIIEEIVKVEKKTGNESKIAVQPSPNLDSQRSGGGPLGAPLPSNCKTAGVEVSNIQLE